MSLAFFCHLLVLAIVAVRILTRPSRTPTSRAAWLAVVAAFPFTGVLAYLVLGETRIDRTLRENMASALRVLPKTSTLAATHRAPPATSHDRSGNISRLASSINGYQPLGGNHARLEEDSNAAIDAMVADIDAAQVSVSVAFYIWLNDTNGTRFAEAVMRAARRGVTVRVMADAIGSKAFIRSSVWRELSAAGVKTVAALPLHGALRTLLFGRVDLRNHRKLLIVDSQIAYCGSQNCADPEFRVKPKFAPWVDIMLRFDGPVALQNQHMFAVNWLAETGENPSELFDINVAAHADGFVAQAIATGPTERAGAMSSMFVELIHHASAELTISTPYFVPDEPILEALTSAARRGVRLRMVFPHRNDSGVVGAVSRAQYRELLSAGVEIHEYVGGLLHAKTLVADRETVLIGSSNLDRRSIDLNYENNILFRNAQAAAAIAQRQEDYIASSIPVDLPAVDATPFLRQVWGNALSMLGPVL